MKLQLMESAAKQGKPIWDSIVAVFGGIAVFMQSALAIETLTWLQAFAALGIGIFGLVRAYFWLINDGYEDEKTNT